MKPLLSKTDNELTALVYTFLKNVLDLPVGSHPDKGLGKKRIICNRTLLFLKHINIYDRMSERVAAAIALWQWESMREDRAELMDQVTKKLETIADAPYVYESNIYSALSIIHKLPTACIETVRELMRRAVDKDAKQRLIILCADLLLTFMNAIKAQRRSDGDLQWTTGAISNAYLLACKILLNELQGQDLSQSQRLQLRDYVISLARFHLSECHEPIDGHEVIVALYDLGEYDVAVDLAEQFKDFKVLIKVCLQLDDADRRARLDEYKRRYYADEFDMYLCRYLKEKKLNHMLLEEKGDRVDRYLLSCEGIRWRRELQNRQFEQVCVISNKGTVSPSHIPT
ncbi:unnamed protein product [Cylicostephanus goldi]|uniref:Nucleoporin Nup133/Nup155-like C-terminal domain-containing protein n=1 Tax=Cylicostephanus goldi TaxID=71465 RepID=A0A3P6RIM0_CYLGO|nr:unnamed protein product [Cylicostephanus goldi]